MWSVSQVVASGKTDLNGGVIRYRIAKLHIRPVEIRMHKSSNAKVFFYADEDFERVITNWDPGRVVKRTHRVTELLKRFSVADLPYVKTRPNPSALPPLMTAKKIAQHMREPLSDVCAAIEALHMSPVILKGGTTGNQNVLHYPSRWIKTIALQIQKNRADSKTVKFTRRRPVEED